MGSMLKPGLPLPTRQATERCPSTPNTRQMSANWAQLIHFLWPFRLSSAPFDVGGYSVTRDCVSLPAPGSVNANAPIVSPFASDGSHRAFWSGVPHFNNAMETMAWHVITSVSAEDPLPTASFSNPNVTVFQPCPP